MENRKVLIAQRGAFNKDDYVRLQELGVDVIYTFDVDGVKQLGDVPLRDYFAARCPKFLLGQVMPTPKTFAEAAYKYADAMLAERDKERT